MINVIKKKDYLFVDFPKINITEKTKRDIIKNPGKYSNCDIRIRMGMFYTDKEIQTKIDKDSRMKMPGFKKLCRVKRK